MSVTVTNHAVVRYIERKYNVDMSDCDGLHDRECVELIEQETGIQLQELVDDMLDDTTKLEIYTHGDGKYFIGDGMTAVVKGGTVVTVFVSASPPKEITSTWTSCIKNVRKKWRKRWDWARSKARRRRENNISVEEISYE